MMAIRRVHAITTRWFRKVGVAGGSCDRSMIGLSMPSMRSRASSEPSRRVRDHEAERRGGDAAALRQVFVLPEHQHDVWPARSAGMKSIVKLAVPPPSRVDVERQVGHLRREHQRQAVGLARVGLAGPHDARA